MEFRLKKSYLEFISFRKENKSIYCFAKLFSESFQNTNQFNVQLQFKQIFKTNIKSMDKSDKTKAKILEKIPLKSKLIMKSALTQKAELMVGRFGYEDSLLAGGYSDGQVRVFNMNTDNKICQIDTNPSKKQITPVNCLRWRPTNEDLSSINSVILVANTNGNLFQYVAKTGKEIYHGVQEGNFIMALDYAYTGKTFATAGKDNIIRVYDEETKTITHKLTGIKWQTHGHNNRIFSLKFKPDDANVLVSGGWDQNVNVWDIREANSVATIFGPKIAGDSVDIRDNLILTGANRGLDQLELWDWKTNKVVTKFRWDHEKQQTNAFLFCAQFCHNSKDTVIAVGGSQMKMFSLTDGTEMLEVKADDGVSLYSCDSGYTSNKYMMGGNSGTLFYMAGVKSYE